MKLSVESQIYPLREKIHFSSINEIARKALFSLLKEIKRGKVILIEDNNRFTFGQATEDVPFTASITVHNSSFYRALVLGSDIGAAEAFMDGSWSTDDLTTVIHILLLNYGLVNKMDKWARVTAPMNKLYHALNRNTRKGSRKNIVAHYDLGNDFYEIFLDETMTYSCAHFSGENDSLRDASLAKYEHICTKLELCSDDHVLEIGSGWGGFALYAAQHYDCHITTTTISQAQFEMAQKRIKEHKVADKVTLLLKDYRDLKGRYDKIVSIEMIEAVGHHYLNSFFTHCNNLLKPQGKMLIQTITISDQIYEKHKESVDFIKRYIFPGSSLPSVKSLSHAITHYTDLKLIHLEDITSHYAQTLSLWRKNFFKNIDKIRSLGFTERFIRMWEFYFCYCEAGFLTNYIGDVQVVLTRPLYRQFLI